MMLCIFKKQKLYLTNLNRKETYIRNTLAFTELTKALGNQCQKMRKEMYSKIISELVSNSFSSTHRLLTIPKILTEYIFFN